MAIQPLVVAKFALHPTTPSDSSAMAKRVHTKPFNSGLIAQLIQVGIIRTVLGRRSSPEIDEDQILHHKLYFGPSSPINILQASGKEHQTLFAAADTIPRSEESHIHDWSVESCGSFAAS